MLSGQWSYWNGPDEIDRREKYSGDFLPDYQTNGDELQKRIAALAFEFTNETGIFLPLGYSSGWRPASVNKATKNSGTRSTHLRAKGGDKRDSVDGAFSWWCMQNETALEEHMLWMEHPVATVVRSWKLALEQQRPPTPWCHLQSEPPQSGVRCYFPDSKAVTEWRDYLSIGGLVGMSHSAWLSLMAE